MGYKEDDENPITMLEDTMLIAYLRVRGHTAIPWISRNDSSDVRVAFDIMGDKKDIEESMQAYHGNEPVGVQDYVRSLREVKSAIYDMKKIGQGSGNRSTK
jgi:hypothetical protein